MHPSVIFSCQILDLVEPLRRLSVIHVAGTKGKVRRAVTDPYRTRRRKDFQGFSTDIKS